MKEHGKTANVIHAIRQNHILGRSEALDLALKFGLFREELRSSPVRGVEGLLLLLPSISTE